MTKHKRLHFLKRKERVTSPVTAPADTNLSDDTDA